MLQKKDYQQQQRYQQHLQKLMLQKKDYQQRTIKLPVTPTKTNVTKEGLPATTIVKQQQSIPATPTKTNVTKEGQPATTKLPATPTTIKKPIVENQTSGKIKTNVTKEGLPTKTKIPVTPTKTNVTKEGLPTKTYNNKETNCRKSNFW